MSALLYLGVAVLISAVGILVLWLRNRKPTSLESGIDQFREGLRALAPEQIDRERGPQGEKGGRRTG